MDMRGARYRRRAPHTLHMRLPFLLVSCLALAACAGAPRPTPPAPEPAPSAAPPASTYPPPLQVAPAWVSQPRPQDELDSLAAWPTEDGRTWIIVTAKATQRLVVFDGETGAVLREIGGPGTAPGRFGRPNGIAVYGDLLFVAERDTHRVQVLRLPDFEPLSFIGADVLKVPYGVWVQETEPGELELLVTDSFMADFRTRQLPPLGELGQRVKRFRVHVAASGDVASEYAGAFGDTGEAGALRMVESIAGDPVHDRLLIADEDVRVGSTLRDYTLDGRYRGTSLPPFQADAEGISLWACDAEGGYWIAADQVDPTAFHVFDRATLQPVGSFAHPAVGETDGQVLYATPTARFPAGALYVQSRNEAVAAFDLRLIARSLRLSPRCLG
jgi:3-phytase